MKNAKLQAFLPFFYLVWSDDLLTQEEFNTLRGFITSQRWLSETEREALLAQIAITDPPPRQEIMDWQTRIREQVEARPGLNHLADIAIALSGNHPTIKALRPLFLRLENDLGVIGEEIIRHFRSTVTNITAGLKTVSSFEIRQLTAILDGKEAAIIQRVKALISEEEFAYVDPSDLQAYREKVYAWCQRLAQEGLGHVAYPQQYGGAGRMGDYFAVMETLSYHDLSLVIKFGVQFGLWGMSVYSLGTEKHHRQYLKDIGTLQLPGCFAMTETNHGSNVRGLETTATYDALNKTFIIHTPQETAQKEYIGNAALHGRMATVFARLIIDGKDYGINAFLVPLRDQGGHVLPGIRIGDCGPKTGLNGVDNGTMRFDQVVIPKDNMLDRFASVNDAGQFESPIPSDDRRFFTMLGTLVGGRIGVPRSALAAAKSGLTIAIRYSDQRRQFGPEGGSEIPILNYRMHQRRLLPLLAKTYALHFSLRQLTDRYLSQKEGDMQAIEALAAGMKAYATWNTSDVLQECREACGGKAYLFENRIGTLKNDTEIYTTFEGDNTVLMQLLAKNRLSVFRKNIGSKNWLGKLGYAWGLFRKNLKEKNFIVRAKTDSAHLLDGDFHHQAFLHREEATLLSAARRLQRLIEGGMDAYDAFNVAQHQMIDVAQAYLERVCLENMQAAVRAIEDEKCKKVMTQLCQLYALSQLEKNRGWYLEDRYMQASKTKAIRKNLNQLCWELRQDAVPLVDAFGIPESCLGAEIARRP